MRPVSALDAPPWSTPSRKMRILSSVCFDHKMWTHVLSGIVDVVGFHSNELYPLRKLICVEFHTLNCVFSDEYNRVESFRSVNLAHVSTIHGVEDDSVKRPELFGSTSRVSFGKLAHVKSECGVIAFVIVPVPTCLVIDRPLGPESVYVVDPLAPCIVRRNAVLAASGSKYVVGASSNTVTTHSDVSGTVKLYAPVLGFDRVLPKYERVDRF